MELENLKIREMELFDFVDIKQLFEFKLTLIRSII